MLQQLFSGAQLTNLQAGTTLSQAITDTKGIVSAEWFNFSNVTFTVMDLAKKTVLDVILPYSHKVKNMQYPTNFVVTSGEFNFLSQVLNAQDGSAANPFFLYGLYECPQAEADERFDVPRTTNLVLDQASGVYNVYGLSYINFNNTCKKVIVKNLMGRGWNLEVRPGTIVNGNYVDDTSPGDSFAFAPGMELTFQGEINRLVFGGGNSGLEQSGFGIANLVLSVEAYYDTANPGLPPSAAGTTASTPSVGSPITLMAGAFQRFETYRNAQILNGAGVGASGSEMFTISVMSNTGYMLGNQRSLLLGIESSQAYDLVAYGCFDSSIYYTNNKGVTLATSQAATPTTGTPPIPSSSLDGTNVFLDLTTYMDVYDLVAQVGLYPAYILAYTNTAASAATLSAYVLNFNNSLSR